MGEEGREGWLLRMIEGREKRMLFKPSKTAKVVLF